MNSKNTAQISSSEFRVNSGEDKQKTHSDVSFPPISNKTLYLLHRGGEADEMLEELFRDEEKRRD